MARSIYGIDIARGAWATVCLVDGSLRLPPRGELVDYAELGGRLRRGDVAVLDIPLGLLNARSGTGDRAVDRGCRKWCSSGSSVFPPPTKAQLAIALRGKRPKGLTVQTFGICNAIESASVARTSGAEIFESHPEVVFSALAKRRISAPKKTLRGVLDRVALLETRVSFDILAWVLEMESTHRGALANDWLDALAMAVVAKDWAERKRAVVSGETGDVVPWRKGMTEFVAMPDGSPPGPPQSRRDPPTAALVAPLRARPVMQSS